MTDRESARGVKQTKERLSPSEPNIENRQV